MWQSFAAIGRGTSEIWMSKEKKNICGKTEARPELIVPGGLNIIEQWANGKVPVSDAKNETNCYLHDVTSAVLLSVCRQRLKTFCAMPIVPRRT